MFLKFYFHPEIHHLADALETHKDNNIEQYFLIQAKVDIMLKNHLHHMLLVLPRLLILLAVLLNVWQLYLVPEDHEKQNHALLYYFLLDFL